ncbi:NAD(P)-dependent oxidoreductase [Pacificibacter marinus]|uniref:2-hydroxy-3-oxopropionate reductase n=1 Tax=Pacificibacter marinus TaxID=658057 RepID=A0A1Y5RKT2_9RHOB|nr:NAD(P)-dependent oxidoreductase [Pacificibacter marinus]SEK19612.1 3-hydroxyisobutyrate dehydrogenase [Pacificibacter marinus]SLN17042.1 2-hydroxy-3-oxopropionate reductase [Pacificibacter marinus]
MTKIGLAGVGRMGSGMLTNMRKGGIDAVGFDIRPASTFPNLPVSNDADNFAQGLTTLITVVRDTAQTDEVLFGAQGFVTRATQLDTIIVSSTLSPKYVRALRDRIPTHINLIDAPMSGAQVGAIEGTLAFMIGGDDAPITAAWPLFEAMGTSLHRMGEFGDGIQAKVLNNLLCASHTVMTRLILDWATEADLDHTKLLALVGKATGQNWFASRFEQIEFARQGYEPSNTIAILEKDVAAALDAAPNGAYTALPELLKQMLHDLEPMR